MRLRIFVQVSALNRVKLLIPQLLSCFAKRQSAQNVSKFHRAGSPGTARSQMTTAVESGRSATCLPSPASR